MSSSVASPAHWRRIHDLLVWTRPQLYTHQGAVAALSADTSSYPFPRACGLVHGWGAFQLPRLRSSTSAPPIWVAMCPFPRALFPRLPFSKDCWWSFLGKLPAENAASSLGSGRRRWFAARKGLQEAMRKDEASPTSSDLLKTLILPALTSQPYVQRKSHMSRPDTQHSGQGAGWYFGFTIWFFISISASPLTVTSWRRAPPC